MITALLVVAILVFLIVVHELGHFVAAKLFRVRVEEFGIGYPPRAFTLGRIGTTEYTLNWIPFGGFVRLFGDIGESQRGKGSLVDANRAVQAVILIAGVAMNAIAAWALFTVALHVGIPRVVETPMPGEPARLVIASVIPGSPADFSGVVAGDEILWLGDEKEVALAELTPEAFSGFVSTRGGKPLTLVYKHGDEVKEAEIIPAHAVVPEAVGRPTLGIGIVLISAQPLSWGGAAREAFTTTKNAFITVGSGLWGIVQRISSGSPAISDIVGPIGLVGIVGDAAENGFGNVVALAAFISVNLTIINLLPIPALDGGRLFLLLGETIARRSAPKLVLQLMNALGVALIVVLMITVTFNDVVRLLT
jgi:regulator of sigma E protease